MSARLTAAGWTATRSGRWHHPAFPGIPPTRRRLFTEADALALVDADPGNAPRSPQELVADAVTEAHRLEAEYRQHRCDEGIIR